MLWFVAWRLRVIGATAALLGAATVAFLIGLSRVHLIEHYVSDVLNGYLMGGLWLVTGIAVVEKLRIRGTPHATLETGRESVALVAFAVSAPCAVGIATTQMDALNLMPAAAAVGASGIDGAGTETLLGAPRGAIVLRIAAADAPALVSAMQAAGWIEATRPGPVTLLRAAWSDWTDAAPPDALIVPNFRASRPNDLAFAAPGGAGPEGRRLHARFWMEGSSGVGMTAFVGSLVREDPTGWLDDETSHRALAASDPAVRALVARLRDAGLDAAAPDAK